MSIDIYLGRVVCNLTKGCICKIFPYQKCTQTVNLISIYKVPSQFVLSVWEWAAKSTFWAHTPKRCRRKKKNVPLDSRFHKQKWRWTHRIETKVAPRQAGGGGGRFSVTITPRSDLIILMTSWSSRSPPHMGCLCLFRGFLLNAFF